MIEIIARHCKPPDAKTVYRFPKYLKPGQMIKIRTVISSCLLKPIDVSGKPLKTMRVLTSSTWVMGLVVRVDKRRKFIDLLIESDLLRLQAQDDLLFSTVFPDPLGAPGSPPTS